MLWEDITRGGATTAIAMIQRDRLLDHIRRLALQGMGERRTDGQLLEHFISERDEAAFALLLRRHGAMVWSVCRRVLGNAHDADDAFQAAFLVLVHKAASIRPREAVGNWLYGVAYRTALEARSRLMRRRAKEQPLQDVPQPESKSEEPSEQLWPILDRELSRLADKYRLPIVLCDLEGRSRREVARQLAIPEGTLSSRLATARKKLASRLARYGFAISAASLGTLLTENSATAGLSFSLLSATTKAALLAAVSPAAVAGSVSATVSTLTQGVLKTMFIAKIKTATLVLCGVAALGVGTGGVYYQTRVGAADSPQVDRVAQDDRKSTSEPRISEIDRLKLENKQLREMLKGERDRKAAYREKLNTFVNTHIKTIMQAEAVVKSALQENKPGTPTLEILELAREQMEMLQKLHEKQYKDELERLQKQRAEFDANHIEMMERERDELADLDKRIEKIRSEQAVIQPNSRPGQQLPKRPPIPANADKLDQILQRLERMEQRLERLERDRK